MSDDDKAKNVLYDISGVPQETLPVQMVIPVHSTIEIYGTQTPEQMLGYGTWVFERASRTKWFEDGYHYTFGTGISKVGDGYIYEENSVLHMYLCCTVSSAQAAWADLITFGAEMREHMAFMPAIDSVPVGQSGTGIPLCMYNTGTTNMRIEPTLALASGATLVIRASLPILYTGAIADGVNKYRRIA